MIPFAYYFLYYAAFAAMLPYLTLFYQNIGFSGTQIGLITGITPLVGLITGPLLSGIADSSRRHKLIFLLSLGGASALALLFPLTRSFWGIFTLIILLNIIMSPANALADSATMNMLEGRRELYGRLRSGGSFGWGIMAWVTGIVLERYGQNWSFWLYAIFMFSAMLVGLFFRFGKSPEKTASIQSGIKTILTNPRWLSFLAMVLVAGMGMATINNYLFLYFSELGATRDLMGFSLTVSTFFSEVPVLLFSDRLVKRFGAHALLIIGLGAIATRLILGSALNLPLGLVAVQLLHGFTFPLILVAGVTYANENAPESVKATAQSLFGAALMGIGSSLGGFLGGWLIDLTGVRNMYFIFGGGLIVALLVFNWMEQRFARKPLPEM